MKKTMLFVLSLMLLAVFTVGCSSDNAAVNESATDAPEATIEAALDTAEDGNVTDDGTTDENAEDETLGDDLEEAADTDDTAVIETTETPDENTED